MGLCSLFPSLRQTAVGVGGLLWSVAWPAPAVAAEAPWSWSLAVDLQPLRPALDKPMAQAPELRPLIAAYRRAKFAQVCQASDATLTGLLHRAAQLFYQPERKGAQTDAIEAFLDRYVRGERALLEIGPEGFMASGPWRSLAVDACLRAGQGGQALRYVAAAATRGPTPRLALSVALAARAQRWADADLSDAPESARAALLRALAATEEAGSWLSQARQLAKTGEDRDLIAAVARHLGRP